MLPIIFFKPVEANSASNSSIVSSLTPFSAYLFTIDFNFASAHKGIVKGKPKTSLNISLAVPALSTVSSFLLKQAGMPVPQVLEFGECYWGDF
ncbi:hypothetical protein RIVM261_056780 [Rivularia sp. IAM M-261]|nr:hypothetical protein RIVM261_056780 [Rivularia sp. IAM M-261]